MSLTVLAAHFCDTDCSDSASSTTENSCITVANTGLRDNRWLCFFFCVMLFVSFPDISVYLSIQLCCVLVL